MFYTKELRCINPFAMSNFKELKDSNIPAGFLADKDAFNKELTACDKDVNDCDKGKEWGTACAAYRKGNECVCQNLSSEGERNKRCGWSSTVFTDACSKDPWCQMVRRATRKPTTDDPNPYYKKLVCQTKKTCRLVDYRFTHFHRINFAVGGLEAHKLPDDNTLHESLKLGAKATTQLCANV